MLLTHLQTLTFKAIGRLLYFGPRLCCYCEKHSPFFIPFNGGASNLPDLMTALQVVGSDVNNFSCPKCNSHDRERHLKLYCNALRFQQHISGARVLHFAPEGYFSKYLQQYNPSLYIKADLFPSAADIQCVDMLNMEFSDHFFDLVVANHVLEHVHDDAKALREIHRVLKPGGLALLQTPFSAMLKHKFEDDGIYTGQARLQAYGQEDHVRLYGSDIFHHIESFGFKNRVQTHAQLLGQTSPHTYGVNAQEPLFLFERK
jgi:predicted SAM-dependent methyltransferase